MEGHDRYGGAETEERQGEIMKRKEWRDMKKIFTFTFRSQMRSKKYRTALILVCILLFAVPLLVMAAAGRTGDSPDPAAQPEAVNPVAQVYVVDETGLGIRGFDAIHWEEEGMEAVSWLQTEDLQAASAAAENTDDSLILLMEEETGAIRLHLLIPEGSSLKEEDFSNLQAGLDRSFPEVLAASAGMTEEQTQMVQNPVQAQVVTGQEDALSGEELAREILSAALPYAFIMVLYFMVLIYGQNVANSVIMEKSSKLMDTFLTSVRPVSMIFGKVFAIVCSSILQFAAWIAALLLGLAAGSAVVKASGGGSGIWQFLAGENWFGELFSLPGMILSVLLLLSGFLLYCAIASIGGSAAGKQEDLSSTNVLFTMILVVSFLVSLAVGGVGIGSSGAASAWVYWVPFTSVLTLPGRLLLGEVSLTVGAGALAVSVAAAVLFLALAAKIYRMMALYKGNPPTPAKLFAMLREKP